MIYLYRLKRCAGSRDWNTGDFMPSRRELFLLNSQLQPFLTPVPPLGSEIISKVTLPLRLLSGIIRATLVLALSLLYVLIVRGVCLVFVSDPRILSGPGYN